MKDTEQVSSAEVVEWLRIQANQFAGMADDIEGIAGERITIPPTVEAVLNQMDGRAIRLSTLSRKLHCGRAELREIMTPANGFIRHPERGWYTYGCVPIKKGAGT